MFAERDWSGVFWAAMMPICWMLAPILALLAQLRIQTSGTLDDRTFQTTLFMSVFLALFGLMAMRILIGRAIDEHRSRQVFALAAITLVASTALIVYGVTTLQT